MSNAQALQISYVPSCSQQAQFNQYNAADAAGYTPDQAGYYSSRVPVMLPGAIIGAVCLLAALAFLGWLLALCCRPRTSWRQPYTKMESENTSQKGRKTVSGRLIMSCIILLLTLAVVGVGTWGLTDSIKDSNHQVGTAWGLVDDASNTVQSIVDIANSAFSLLQKLGASLRATSKTAVGIADLVPFLSGVASIDDQAAKLNSTASDIDSLVASGTKSVAQIQTKGIGNIQKAQDRFQHKTEVAWNPWRPIVMAVLFGLLIVFAIVACCTAISRRFPRTTATFTLLLWLMTAIFFILGSGGLNGAFHIGKDTCLYVETFAINTATGDSPNSNRASTALEYYFGQIDIPANDVPYEIYGINTTELTTAVNSPVAQIFLGFLDNAQGQAFIANTSVLNDTEKGLVVDLPSTLNQLNSSILALTAAVQVSAMSPLYQRAKDLVCCQVTDVLHKLWIAWTVTAAVSAALAIILTAHVMTSVGPVRRGEQYAQTDSSAPGRGSMFRNIRRQPGQYRPGQYSNEQFIKSGGDTQPSAPPMSV